MEKYIHLIQYNTNKSIFILNQFKEDDYIKNNHYISKIYNLLIELDKHCYKLINLFSNENNNDKLKEEIRYIYNNFTEIDEINNIINNSYTDINQKEMKKFVSLIDQTRNIMIKLVKDVIEKFGYNNSLYIVSPHFQALSNMLWKYIKLSEGY